MPRASTPRIGFVLDRSFNFGFEWERRARRWVLSRLERSMGGSGRSEADKF